MRVEPYECSDKNIEQVRRIESSHKSNIRFEVCVLFSDKETRDYVASHGKILANFKDKNDLQTAGTRFDYPTYQGLDFRALEWYSRQMRINHGTAVPFLSTIRQKADKITCNTCGRADSDFSTDF